VLIFQPVLRIRIRGSIPYICLMDPDADPDPAIFVSDLQDIKKILSKSFFANFFEVHLHNFSKIKSHTLVTKQ
jgi:hypothetical protein